jgi:chromosome segregation ATPase
MDISTMIEVLGFFLGGGGIGALISWQYLRRQEAAKTKEQEANAVSAEVNATKEVQDVYQQMVNDLKEAWKEQKEYISELNNDRRNLREERNDLRAQIDQLKKELEDLREDMQRQQEEARKERMRQEDKVAHLSRVVKAMKPLMCSMSDCRNREQDILTLVDDESFTTNEEKATEKERQIKR